MNEDVRELKDISEKNLNTRKSTSKKDSNGYFCPKILKIVS